MTSVSDLRVERFCSPENEDSITWLHKPRKR